jgi:hypothetical protein
MNPESSIQNFAFYQLLANLVTPEPQSAEEDRHSGGAAILTTLELEQNGFLEW